MLRLNPGDNQGIRYLLAHALLDMDQDEELQSLVAATSHIAIAGIGVLVAIVAKAGVPASSST